MCMKNRRQANSNVQVSGMQTDFKITNSLKLNLNKIKGNASGVLLYVYPVPLQFIFAFSCEKSTYITWLTVWLSLGTKTLFY